MDWFEKQTLMNRIILAAMVITFTIVTGLYISMYPEDAYMAGGIWGFCIAANIIRLL